MIKLKYTKLQLALETAGLVIGLAAAVWLIVNWRNLPDQIPAHFNARGEVNRWGGKGELLIAPVIGAVLYGFVTLLGFFPQIWNAPVKITPKNQAAVWRATRTLLIVMKLEMAAIFCYITYCSALSHPLGGWYTSCVIIMIFGTIVVSILQIRRAGRIHI